MATIFAKLAGTVAKTGGKTVAKAVAKKAAKTAAKKAEKKAAKKAAKKVGKEVEKKSKEKLKNEAKEKLKEKAENKLDEQIDGDDDDDPDGNVAKRSLFRRSIGMLEKKKKKEKENSKKNKKKDKKKKKEKKRKKKKDKDKEKNAKDSKYESDDELEVNNEISEKHIGKKNKKVKFKRNESFNTSDDERSEDNRGKKKHKEASEGDENIQIRKKNKKKNKKLTSDTSDIDNGVKTKVKKKTLKANAADTSDRDDILNGTKVKTIKRDTTDSIDDVDDISQKKAKKRKKKKIAKTYVDDSNDDDNISGKKEARLMQNKTKFKNKKVTADDEDDEEDISSLESYYADYVEAKRPDKLNKPVINSILTNSDSQRDKIETSKSEIYSWRNKYVNKQTDPYDNEMEIHNKARNSKSSSVFSRLFSRVSKLKKNEVRHQQNDYMENEQPHQHIYYQPQQQKQQLTQDSVLSATVDHEFNMLLFKVAKNLIMEEFDSAKKRRRNKIRTSNEDWMERFQLLLDPHCADRSPCGSSGKRSKKICLDSSCDSLSKYLNPTNNFESCSDSSEEVGAQCRDFGNLKKVIRRIRGKIERSRVNQQDGCSYDQQYIQNQPNYYNLQCIMQQQQYIDALHQQIQAQAMQFQQYLQPMVQQVSYPCMPMTDMSAQSTPYYADLTHNCCYGPAYYYPQG